MTHTSQRHGFTITELMTVIVLIGILIAITVPAVTGGWKVSAMSESMHRMKQISTWMTLYGSDNRDAILPSQFDYSQASYPGKACSDHPDDNLRYKGTWADILWTENDLYKTVMTDKTVYDPSGTDPDQPIQRARSYYRYKAPDGVVYDSVGGYDNNPLRSAVTNSYNFPRPVGGDNATPYGTGATEKGLAGYFAANDHFNQRIGNNFTYGQIKQPSVSMYLVDSIAGETIGPEVGAYPWSTPLSVPPVPPSDEEAYWDSFREAFDFSRTDTAMSNSMRQGQDLSTGQVDFRYGNQALMLFLDGHTGSVKRWGSLEGLETGSNDGSQVRVTGLTDKHSPICEDDGHGH